MGLEKLYARGTQWLPNAIEFAGYCRAEDRPPEHRIAIPPPRMIPSKETREKAHQRCAELLEKINSK